MPALESLNPQQWPLDLKRPIIWGARGNYDGAIAVRAVSGELITRITGELGGPRESVDALLQRAASRCPGQALTLVYAPLRAMA